MPALLSIIIEWLPIIIIVVPVVGAILSILFWYFFIRVVVKPILDHMLLFNDEVLNWQVLLSQAQKANQHQFTPQMQASWNKMQQEQAYLTGLDQQQSELTMAGMRSDAAAAGIFIE